MPVDNAYIEFAHKLAERSGELIRAAYRRPVEVTVKDDQSPMTKADWDAEAIMRQMIAESFPAHGIWGEEQGVSAASAEYMWVIDPIDGTKAFMAGIPTFTTLIALLYKGEPVLGIASQPISRELWLGVAGMPTTLNGRPVKSSQRKVLGDALFGTTSPYLFSDAEKIAFETLRVATRQQVYGGDAYGYAMVASGSVDMVVEAGLKPHDIAALIPILQGSGAVITDWKGATLDLLAPSLRVIAAATLELHAEALTVLKRI